MWGYSLRIGLHNWLSCTSNIDLRQPHPGFPNPPCNRSHVDTAVDRSRSAYVEEERKRFQRGVPGTSESPLGACDRACIY